MIDQRARGAAGRRRIGIVLAVAAAVLAQPVLAQQPTVQPAKGQSAEQMQQDMAACHGTASQATGYTPSQQQPATASGKRLRGAAAGATAGAVRAEARGNDFDNWDKVDDDRKQDYRRDEARSAARAGAAVGGMAARADRRGNRRQQAQQQTQATAWEQSYGSCLQGKGYTVTP